MAATPDTPDERLLTAGEPARFDCDDCTREFEVTLEPKERGFSDGRTPRANAEILCCPFCGSRDITQS
jgi:Zn finger protein HypA/HybF involved in hydrogenase expression